VLTEVDGGLEHWPVTQDYIERMCGENWIPAFTGTPANFEEAALSMMPAIIYTNFVKPYTEKQWGVPAESLAPDLVKRFQINKSGDYRLSNKKHQGVPTNGYTRWVQAILENIPVFLNVDFLENGGIFSSHKYRDFKLIYTGQIDEYFGYKFGKLGYRGQKRKTVYMKQSNWYQGAQSVNNPGDGDHIRTTEWKYYMEPSYAERIKGTVITRETPFTPTSPDVNEYPFPSAQNKVLYEQYKELADRVEKNVLFCGRLGEYRYYDMEQAIGRAMMLAERLLSD